MVTVKRRHGVLPVFALIIGCMPDGDARPGQKPQRKEWPQVCEMCGTEWMVIPNDPDEAVPPTVEWCFHDGQYCEVGFAMMIEKAKDGESADLERRLINHCLTCKGCRCAAFSPEEWRKVQ